MVRLYTLILGLLFFMSGTIFSDVPSSIKLEGQLTSTESGLLEGNYDIIVHIYHDLNSTTPIWTQPLNSVSFTNGRFSFTVGSDTHPITEDLFNSETIILGIVVDGEEITTETLSVPTAIRSKWADEASSVDWANIQNTPNFNELITEPELADGHVVSAMIADAAITLDKLTTTGLETNHILKWNGTAWIATQDANTTYTAGSGLSLNGTEFNLVEGSIGSSIITDGSITTDKIADQTITVSKLGQNGAETGQLLKWTGSTWVADDDRDTDTTYTAGRGLTLNATTFSIDSSVVTSNYAGTVTATYFVGDGSGLTNLNIGGSSISDEDGTTKIQVEESDNDDVIRFDIAGIEAFLMTGHRLEFLNSGDSVFIGEGAGANDDLSHSSGGAGGPAGAGFPEEETITSNKNVFIGYNAGQINSTGFDNVLIGYQSGYSNTTGARNAFIGTNSGYSNTTGGNNSFIGNNSGYSNTTGGSNSFIGSNSGYSNTTGYGNSFVGNYSGYSNTTGSNNSFIGNNSGRSNSTGSNNSFIGNYSGYYNTTGANNSFVGTYSGHRNTTGVSNSFIGSNSGQANTEGANNSFLGNFSGYNTTTGSYNSFMGSWSGLANTTGSYNSFIGEFSGGSNTEGSKNTYLGVESGRNNRTGNNNVFLGYQAGYYEEESNKLYISNSNTSSPLIYGDFSTNQMVINGNNTNNESGYTFYVNGAAGGADAWHSLSDRRLKTNITTIENPLEKVLALRGVTYTWKDSSNHKEGTQLGFIAQETEPILPEVVTVPKTEDKMYSMSYAPITAVLVEAVKEQQKLIEKQQATIDSQQELLEALAPLKDEVEQLKEDIRRLQESI